MNQTLRYMHALTRNSYCLTCPPMFDSFDELPDTLKAEQKGLYALLYVTFLSDDPPSIAIRRTTSRIVDGVLRSGILARM